MDPADPEDSKHKQLQDDDEDDQSTKQVLEYYQKFSQNRGLPKYFSGSSVSYLPEIKVPEIEPEFPPRNLSHISPLLEPRDNIVSDVVITTNVDIVVTHIPDKDDEDKKDLSRASSVTSNRKLEWDNGADIGYSNCGNAIFKSTSLPILSKIKDKPIDFNVPKSDSNVKVFILNYSSSDDSPGIKEIQSSTSSSPPVEKSKIISTSTSVSSEKKPTVSSTTTASEISTKQREDPKIISDGSDTNIVSFATTLQYLKCKIGMPDAHSTPKVLEVGKSDSDLQSSSPPKTPRNKSQKRIKKSPRKETKFKVGSDDKVVNKMDNPPEIPSKTTSEGTSKSDVSQKRKLTKKVINLALTKPVTVECCSVTKTPKNKTIQTAVSVNTVGVQTDIIPPLELQDLISTHVIKNQSVIFVEHHTEQSTDERRTSCCTQTESDIVASNCDSFEYIKNTEVVPHDTFQNEASALPAYEEGKLKRSQRVDDLNTKASSKAEATSSSLSSNEVEVFTKDIEKSVELLQKLLKSNNYDAKTKKKYMKKIVKKISNNKFLEDSSTSSELFFPKKSKSEIKKTVRIETNSDTSDPKNAKSWLESNLPWYPAHDQIKTSASYKKLVVKTFQDEIPARSSQSSSQPEIIPVQHSPKQFTLTNNEFAVNPSTSKSSNCEGTSLEKNCDSSKSSKCYENWKEDKTHSEKLYEARSNSNNYLVDIAKKEKEHQITWINNEITHLSKLKNLLEKEGSLNKKTSVYKVQQTNSNEGREYVIQTDIGAQTSGNINFNLDGNQYCVKELNSNSKTEHKLSDNNVVGDIDVSVHDKVTNIRVKTFCQKCKQTPCICSNQNSKNNAKQSGRSICLYCRKVSCICYQNKNKYQPCSSSGYTGVFLPTMSGLLPTTSTFPPMSEKIPAPIDISKTSCSICGNLPCICVNRKTITSSEILRDYDFLKNEIVSTTNSLKRVFDNCKCSSEEICKCSFVEKLLRHFKTAGTSTENVRNVDIQTECCKATDSLTQTDYNVRHEGIQVDKDPTRFVCSQTSKQPLLTNKNEETQSVQLSMKEHNVQASALQKEQVIQTPKTQNKESIMQTYTVQEKKTIEDPMRHNKNVETSSVQIKSADVQTIVDLSRMCSAQTKREISDKNIQSKLESLRVKTQTICDIISTPTQTYEQHNNNHKISEVFPENKIVSIEAGKNVENCDEQCETFTVRRDNLTQTQNNDLQSTIAQTNLKDKQDIFMQTRNLQRLASSQVDRPSKNVASSQLEGIALKDATNQTEKLKRKHASTEKSICDCMRSKKSSARPQPKIDKYSQMVQPRVFDGETDSIKVPLYVDEPEFKDAGTTYSYAGIGKQKSRNLQTEGNEMKDDDVQYSERTNGFEEESEGKDETISSTHENGTVVTSESTSGSSNTHTTTSDKVSTESGYVYVRCMCCKEKTPSQTSTALRSSNQTYNLCQHCIQRRPILTSMCYKSPQHTCHCYNRIQYYGQYCTCVKPSKKPDSVYCNYCRYKLKRTTKSRGGIAYTLTLENVSPTKLNRSKVKKKKSELEEIVVKVPKGHSRKKHKDKENYNKQSNGKINEDIVDNNTTNSDEKVASRKQFTLQEYLNQNRPEFVDSADHRRNIVQSAREQRVENKDKAKLKFLEENSKKDQPEKNYKLFSEKEMKEITRKNYKKLPEVQRKLDSQREKRLRDADKAIKDIFTKKVQRNVLKGKRDFPIDTNIVNLPNK